MDKNQFCIKEISRGIMDVLIREINVDLSPDEIMKCKNLINEAGLDSIKIMELLVGLENRFNIRFDDESITKELFFSIDKLGEYIKKKLKQKNV
ncbi:MAG: phosphopantetheine-binding protein [Candidatus Theseobacter exili]|nr:phosphopantetheine-binding protein [Candidatus Theseobacter exili]